MPTRKWLDVAQRIQSEVENDVTNALRRHRRIARHRLATSATDPDRGTESHVAVGAKHSLDEAEDSDESPFSDASHARLLRDMARRLEMIADDLAAPDTGVRAPELDDGYPPTTSAT